MQIEKKEILLPNSTPLMATPARSQYVEAATSANTRRAYQADIRHFRNAGGLLPTTADVLVRYLEEHAQRALPFSLEQLLKIHHELEAQGTDSAQSTLQT